MPSSDSVSKLCKWAWFLAAGVIFWTSFKFAFPPTINATAYAALGILSALFWYAAAMINQFLRPHIPESKRWVSEYCNSTAALLAGSLVLVGMTRLQGQEIEDVLAQYRELVIGFASLILACFVLSGIVFIRHRRAARTVRRHFPR